MAGMDIVKMTSLSNIALFLLTLVPVIFGNADILSRTLLDRIEALERRDTEQIARIGLLEEQARVFKEKLDFLSTSNKELQKQLAYQAKKIHDQEDIIADLRKDVEHYKTLTQESMRHFNILQSKVQKMDKKFQDTMQNYQDNLEITKEMKPDTDSSKNKIKTHTDLPELTTNTAAENGEIDRSDVELKKEDSFNTGMHDTDIDTVKDTLNAGTDKDILHETTNGQLRTTWTDTKQHAVRSVTDPVAFQVVQTQQQLNPHIQNAVKFENVQLNQGNAYHAHHGLFIAPQPGFYLFSTSITCSSSPGHVQVQASIMKNGARLARLYCHGVENKGTDQGSVTTVTHLNTADEIWIEFDWPDGGYVLGNGFSSFTGILIM